MTGKIFLLVTCAWLVSSLPMSAADPPKFTREELVQRLGEPELKEFGARLEQAEDGSTWIEWQTRAGCVEQLEYSQDLTTWSEIGAAAYRFGQLSRVKILDAPSPNTGTGGGTPSAVQNETTSVNFLVSPFENQKTLISFHSEYGPYRILLDLDYSDIVSRPIYAKHFKDGRIND
jgi:hypothetical protein